MKYTLWCLVLGEESIFSVKVDETQSVDDLKDKIKNENPCTLKDVSASELTLYKLASDVDENQSEVEDIKHEQFDLKKKQPLHPMDELTGIFSDTVNIKLIHVLVVRPRTTPHAPTTPPNHPAHASKIPFTPTRDEVIKTRVDRFINDLRHVYEVYLNDNVQLPLWQPSLNLDDKVRSHITGLKIPIICSSSQVPSLLLHNLGQSTHDPQLATRVSELFRPKSMTTFLCNTSGSGKTRLLLEGLSRNWGFYFTARTQPEGVGSSDLEMVRRDLKPRLEKITDENHATVLTSNQNIASRHFLLLLFARYLCFRVFLQCTARMDGGITENHKLRWLLIQVAPVTLLAESDMFLELTEVAGRASEEYLQNAIRFEKSTIKDLLPRRSTLFCVLDEAQVLTKDSDYFRSDEEPNESRPILCPIVLNWRKYCPNLIISGTGISMQKVETVFGFAVAKEGLHPVTVTEVGGFDDEDGRRAYLEQYFPPGLLDTSEGKEVASRVGYWLRGRHRFIATYLSRLIQSGFQSPHQVLNDFVFGMTGFRPSDWDDSKEPTVELENLHGFNFKSLLRETELLPTLGDFVLEYTFTGKIRGLGGPIGDAMVEFGVSRFTLEEQTAQTDEPLTLLALVTLFEQEKQTLAKYLTRNLNSPDPASRGITFEAFGAYLIARAFCEPRRLTEVFQFVERDKHKRLQKEVAELVTLEKVGDDFQTTPLQITTNRRSSHVLGRSAKMAPDTLEWLRNPKGSAFCFPANTVGPDLIFVLRLKNESKVLRVCVQFKHTKALSPQGSAKAIRTTDPSFFLSQKTKDKDSPTCSDPVMRDEMEEAIKNLGIGTMKAGPCGLLRVLMSHPSHPDSNALKGAAKGRHPLAIVPVSFLEPSDSTLGQSVLSLANMALQRPDLKRRSSDEIVGDRPKRQRRGADTGVGGPKRQRR